MTVFSRAGLGLLSLVVPALVVGCEASGSAALDASRGPEDSSIPTDAGGADSSAPSAEQVCVDASRHLAECLDDAPPSDSVNPDCDIEEAREILGLTCEELANELPAAVEMQNSRLAEIACSLRLYRFCGMQACDPEADEPGHILPSDIPETATACAREALQYEGCGACEYYRCREASANCGSEGYLMNYAYRYCQRFRLVVEDQMSPEGQAWFRRVRRCLVTALDAAEPGNDCRSLEEEGFGSHPECYLETGFCDLPLSDWIRVFNSVDPNDLRFRELLTTGNGCVRDWF